MKRTQSAAVCLFFLPLRQSWAEGGWPFSSEAPWAKLFLRGRTKTSKRLQNECYLRLPLRQNLNFETPFGPGFSERQTKTSQRLQSECVSFMKSAFGENPGSPIGRRSLTPQKTQIAGTRSFSLKILQNLPPPPQAEASPASQLAYPFSPPGRLAPLPWRRPV